MRGNSLLAKRRVACRKPISVRKNPHFRFEIEKGKICNQEGSLSKSCGAASIELRRIIIIMNIAVQPNNTTVIFELIVISSVYT